MHAAVIGIIAAHNRRHSVAGPYTVLPVMVTESPNTYRGRVVFSMPLGVTQSPNAVVHQSVAMVPTLLNQSANAALGTSVVTLPPQLSKSPNGFVMQNVATLPVGLNAITTPLIVKFNTQPFVDSSIYNEPMTTTVGAGSGQSITMVPGLFGGNAASFSGADHRISTVNAIPLPGSFIIEGWVNFSSIPTSGQGRFWMWIYRYIAGASDVQVTIRPGGIIRFNFLGNFLDSSVPVVANQWYHVCFTRLNDTLYMMLDGVIVATLAGQNSAGGNKIWFGGSLLSDGIGVSAQSHHGLLDSWRIISGTGRNANFTPPTAEYS